MSVAADVLPEELGARAHGVAFDGGGCADGGVLKAIARGEFQLRGMTNGELRARLPGRNSGQVSRLLKRLRVHGLIRKIARSYRYHLTAFGKQVIALAFKLRETVVLPELDLIRATA